MTSSSGAVAPRRQSTSSGQSHYNKDVAAPQQTPGTLTRSTSSDQPKMLLSQSSTATINLPTLSTNQRSSNEVAKQPTPISKTPATTATKSATISAKTAPAAPTPGSSPVDSSRGRWRHPRMDEIQRRQRRTVFDRSNTNVVLYNALGIALSFGLSAAQNLVLPTQYHQNLQPYSFYTYLFLRLFLLANIIAACVPLFRKQDPCEDIPLTPHQRKLLGLPPMSRPATPQEEAQYVTPPRYTRSATPASTSSSLYVQTAGSPLSSRGGSAFASPAESPRRASGSYYYSPSAPTTDVQARKNGSPYGPSPLRNGLGLERRRLSYTNTRNSPHGGSDIDAFWASGGIETPTKTHRASVGLNSKWLYEKGRGSPSMWGSGSVFM